MEIGFNGLGSERVAYSNMPGLAIKHSLGGSTVLCCAWFGVRVCEICEASRKSKTV